MGSNFNMHFKQLFRLCPRTQASVSKAKPDPQQLPFLEKYHDVFERILAVCDLSFNNKVHNSLLLIFPCKYVILI